MKFDIRRFAEKAYPSVIGFVLIAVIGITALGKDNNFNEKSQPNSSTSIVSKSQYIVTNYKKAALSEYDMSQEAVKVTAKAKTKTAEPKKIEVTNFTVDIPDDYTVVYECEPTPLNFYETRDIKDEIYSVYDENSDQIVTLNGFDLVCQIVNNEISDSWGWEAIKAQAVAAYSYVRFNDDCDKIPSVGLRPGYSAIIEDCVNAVSGQAVYYDGSIIDAVYSASTAGCSTESSAVWGTQYPYLLAVVSPYDEKDPHYGVQTVLSKDEVKKIIESKTDIKLSDDLKKWFGIQSVYSRKYIADMTIDEYTHCRIDGKMSRITGTVLASILGLKNNAFEIEYDNGNFIFTTYGWGHGVGMSQWGACYYAEAGYTYDQILRHYYLDTSICLSDENQKAVERGQQDSSEDKSEQNTVDASSNFSQNEDNANNIDNSSYNN
ncbi:MAG: SpoIID/LytB domain-containing protein [Ruminococcus sp.]|nr:SpoIID/LytB domain-containing protein [Ruminococcus sp.]